MENIKTLSQAQEEELLGKLKSRFEKFRIRHQGIEWEQLCERLKSNPGKMWSLGQMEETGGEPDVIGLDRQTGEYLFVDCSAETPRGRRSLCFDREALEERKEFKPENSAADMAAAMGIELLTEVQYRELQKLGNFDSKTSSWIQTPPEIRKLGGALFADFRYGNVFIYHNGAQSYYAVRGFRGLLRI